MTYPTLHLSVAIARPREEVYAFASDPANLPKWAAGLAAGVERVGNRWFAASPQGRVEVRFRPPNHFGVLDHEVVLPDGETVNVPMRVVPNDEGSEVLFTLFRRPGMTDEAFAADAAAVRRDLQALKALLEARPRDRLFAPGPPAARPLAP